MVAKRKRNTKYDPKNTNNNFKGYVKCDISKLERQDYLTWAKDKDLPFFWDILTRLVDSDYKLAIKPDNYGGGVMASLTCASTGKDDEGLVLTARAPDMDNAVMLLVYKHVVVLDGQWAAWQDENKEENEWA